MPANEIPPPLPPKVSFRWTSNLSPNLLTVRFGAHGLFMCSPKCGPAQRKAWQVKRIGQGNPPRSTPPLLSRGPQAGLMSDPPPTPEPRGTQVSRPTFTLEATMSLMAVPS